MQRASVLSLHRIKLAKGVRSWANIKFQSILALYWTGYPILKSVHFATTNVIHNMDLNRAALIVSKTEINEGTIVKKIKTSSLKA